MHSVLETDTFSKSVKELGLSEEERVGIHVALSENPELGDLIKGTGGARKWRFRKAGHGKSGGYRVVSYYAAVDVPVFLLDIYDKSEKVNLSQSERNELKRFLATVAENYRASSRAKTKTRIKSER